MAAPKPRRFYFDEYALTYTKKGWALLHKDEGLVGSDQFPSAVKLRSTKDGGNMLEYVEEIMEKGLGDSI